MSSDDSPFDQQIEGLSDLTTLSNGEYLRTFAGEYEGEQSRSRQVQLRTPQTDAVDEDLEEAIITEAQNWRKAATHPNIVELIDWGTDPQPWVLVTDIRTSLETSLSALSLPESLEVISEAAEGLRNAALYNTTHGNLTPGNVKVVDGDPMALVDDWGLERVVATHVEDSSVTPYTAPEQIDSSLDSDAEATDVYGLGAVAYYALTGHPPLAAEADAILSESPVAPSEYRAQVPPEVDDLLLRTLSAEPTERPDSVLQFANQFERATEALASRYPNQEPAGQDEQPPRSNEDPSRTSAAGASAGAGAHTTDQRADSQPTSGGSRDDTAGGETQSPRTTDPSPRPGSQGLGKDDEPSGSGTRRAVLALLGVGAATAGAAHLLLRDLEESSAASSVGEQTPTPTETDRRTATEEPVETPTATESQGSTGRPESTVKIGALQPLSGPLAFYGRLTAWGWYTAFGMKDGVSIAALPAKDSGAGDYRFDVENTTYELLLRDTKASPTEAQSLAGDLVRDENVDLLLGVTNSGGAQNVANNVASQANVPLMVGPAASASVTNSNEYCSEYVYRTAETTEMDAYAQGKYLANETVFEDVWIFFADSNFGRSINTFYTKALEENGANVLGRTALSQGYSADWAGQFERAKAAGADAILGGFTVATLPQMTQTYLSNGYPFRFVGGYNTMAGAAGFGGVIDQVLEGELTSNKIWQSGLGPFTTRYHWNQYDNEYATEALQIHRERYDQNLDLYSGGAHAAISAIDQAVMQSGSTNSDDILTEWKGMEIQETLKGEGNYKFQEYNNQARSSMSVAPLIPTKEPEYWQAPTQPGEPDKVYAPDETTIKSDDVEMTCQL